MNQKRKLPKSLHTVTVLVRVAEMEKSEADCHGEGPISHETAIRCALITLGLDELDDVYGLAASALKQLEKN